MLGKRAVFHRLWKMQQTQEPLWKYFDHKFKGKPFHAICNRKLWSAAHWRQIWIQINISSESVKWSVRRGGQREMRKCNTKLQRYPLNHIKSLNCRVECSPPAARHTLRAAAFPRPQNGQTRMKFSCPRSAATDTSCSLKLDFLEKYRTDLDNCVQQYVPRTGASNMVGIFKIVAFLEKILVLCDR